MWNRNPEQRYKDKGKQCSENRSRTSCGEPHTPPCDGEHRILIYSLTFQQEKKKKESFIESSCGISNTELINWDGSFSVSRGSACLWLLWISIQSPSDTAKPRDGRGPERGQRANDFISDNCVKWRHWWCFGWSNWTKDDASAFSEQGKVRRGWHFPRDDVTMVEVEFLLTSASFLLLFAVWNRPHSGLSIMEECGVPVSVREGQVWAIMNVLEGPGKGAAFGETPGGITRLSNCRGPWGLTGASIGGFNDAPPTHFSCYRRTWFRDGCQSEAGIPAAPFTPDSVSVCGWLSERRSWCTVVSTHMSDSTFGLCMNTTLWMHSERWCVFPRGSLSVTVLVTVLLAKSCRVDFASGHAGSQEIQEMNLHSAPALARCLFSVTTGSESRL